MKQVWFIIGCFGKVEDDVQFCAGTKNFVVCLSDKPDGKEIASVLKFHYRVLPQSNEYTNIKNSLNYLFERKLIGDEKYKALLVYLKQHASCGLYTCIEVI